MVSGVGYGCGAWCLGLRVSGVRCGAGDLGCGVVGYLAGYQGCLESLAV